MLYCIYLFTCYTWWWIFMPILNNGCSWATNICNLCNWRTINNDIYNAKKKLLKYTLSYSVMLMLKVIFHFEKHFNDSVKVQQSSLIIFTVDVSNKTSFIIDIYSLSVSVKFWVLFFSYNFSPVQKYWHSHQHIFQKEQFIL